MGGGAWSGDENTHYYLPVPGDGLLEEAVSYPDERLEKVNSQIDKSLDSILKVHKDVPLKTMVPSNNVHLPSPEEYDLARMRLVERMHLYDVAEFPIDGDGSCQFASLSDQLFRNLSKTQALREAAVAQLRSKPEYYIEFVHNTSYQSYCDRMALPTTWGDNLTLQALADRLGIVVNLITSYETAPFIEVRPRSKNIHINRHVWMSFYGEVHYNSLYPKNKIAERMNQRNYQNVDSPDCQIM